MFIFNNDYCCCNQEYNCCNLSTEICCNECIQSSCKPLLERALVKQVCESNVLTLDKCKADIKEIKESCMKVVINGCKVIESPVGSKIFITGTKFIKIKYSAIRKNKCSCTLEEVCFTVPFSTCIALPNCSNYTIIDARAKVLCCEFKKCGCKLISEATLIELCIKLIERGKDCCENPRLNRKYIRVKNDCF